MEVDAPRGGAAASGGTHSSGGGASSGPGEGSGAEGGGADDAAVLLDRRPAVTGPTACELRLLAARQQLSRCGCMRASRSKGVRGHKLGLN